MDSKALATIRSTSARRCFFRAAARRPACACRLALFAADDDDDDPPWVELVPHEEDEDEELELPHPPPQATRVGISKPAQNATDRTIAVIR